MNNLFVTLFAIKAKTKCLFGTAPDKTEITAVAAVTRSVHKSVNNTVNKHQSQSAIT